MAAEKHALLGASSAERWLACTPSARLEAEVPNTGTAYTEEGTLAHAVCELKLQSYFSPMSKRTLTSRLNKLKKDERFTLEMERCADLYLDYARELALAFPTLPTAAIEDRVDFSRWVPEGFGTADLVLLCGDTLQVVDFKYGKGHAVCAERNPQMMLYALGAYEKYRLFYEPKRIRMAIFQPRIRETPEEWEASIDELLRWAEDTVKPAAALAFEGKGEQIPGDHCRFCRIKGRCRAYAAPHISAAEDFARFANNLTGPAEPAALTETEIGNALALAKPFRDWLSAVEDYALGAVLAGRDIPGWKAVEGVSRRRFRDQEAAFEALRTGGVAEEILYERVPLSLAKLEKTVGKTEFQQLAGMYIEKPPGKPALVPESDPRPVFHPAAQDFAPLP